MSTALFFITHEGIAHNLIAIAETIIKKTSRNLCYYEVAMDADSQLTSSNIEDKIKQLDLDDGIIFITDIFGSTPSNTAQQFAKKYAANLITGVNLAMVIRLLNYRDENQHALLKKALDGAVKSIQDITPDTNKIL